MQLFVLFSSQPHTSVCQWLQRRYSQYCANMKKKIYKAIYIYTVIFSVHRRIHPLTPTTVQKQVKGEVTSVPRRRLHEIFPTDQIQSVTQSVNPSAEGANKQTALASDVSDKAKGRGSNTTFWLWACPSMITIPFLNIGFVSQNMNLAQNNLTLNESHFS